MSIHIYEVMSGPFIGYTGHKKLIAGILHLKSDQDYTDWDYIMVTESQIEYIFSI